MNEISKIFNKLNSWIAFIFTSLNTTLGTECILFAGYLFLNVLDYLTGICKAKFTGTESSSLGLKGIIKKIGYWLLILISFFIPFLLIQLGKKLNINLDFIIIFGWFTVACLIVNETRSILENLIELGVKVPQVLIKGLEIYQNAIDGTVEKIIEQNNKDEELKKGGE